MEHTYFSVDQVAKMLDIHPKTIQRYIREGKLHATKIGKSWRISGHDLSRFTEGAAAIQPVTAPAPIQHEKTKASSVIDISVSSLEDAVRIINAMNAAMNSKPAEYGSASMHTQFLDSENILRLTLWGSIGFMSVILGALEALME